MRPSSFIPIPSLSRLQRRRFGIATNESQQTPVPLSPQCWVRWNTHIAIIFLTVRYRNRLSPSQISKIVISTFGDTLNPGELVFSGENTQPSTLELCFARWKDDKNIGVVGKAVDDEIEDASLYCERIELMR